MTPQQERIRTGNAWDNQAGYLRHVEPSSTRPPWITRFIKFCERQARNNRHAHKRHAS